MSRVLHQRNYWYAKAAGRRTGRPSEMLDWVERAGIECMKEHVRSAEIIAKESVTTLTVLLAGIGAGLAFVIRSFQAPEWSWAVWGAAGFTLYLMVISVMVICWCLTIREYPSPFNEPKNLYHPDYSLDEVRRVEMDNLQARIDDAAAENTRSATCLNRLRLLAALSPLAFTLSVGAWAGVLAVA